MTQSSEHLPVLGLFKDEAALRDHVAANLDVLEAGLTLSAVEYPLENASGAGGRLDILAQDPFGHVVIIEIKRSDQSARSALNELAKYAALLIRDHAVPRASIRAIVLSTHWAELKLPLSFFAAEAGFSIEGREVVRDGDSVTYRVVDLTPISELPPFSPEIELFQYASDADRAAHLATIRQRASELPFVKLAVVGFDAFQDANDSPFRSIACLWRLKLEDHTELERRTGHAVGWLFPYAYPDWEAECDALFWLCTQDARTTLFESAEATRGSPEKVKALLSRYTFAGVSRIGAWPPNDLVNSDAKILEQLTAVSRIVSDDRPNRYSFRQLASPRFVDSWRRATEGYLKFIAFQPLWRAEAETFLTALTGRDAKVQLSAFDKNHVLFAIHQARVHPETQLSHFTIAVEWPDGRHTGLTGFYVWNGAAPVRDAEAAAVRTFGSVSWAGMAIFSGIDTERYDEGLADHGFEPAVLKVAVDAAGAQSVTPVLAPSRDAGRLADFIAAHPDYVTEVASLFADVPTGPHA